MKTAVTFLIRPLATFALAGSLAGCALPLAPNDPSSDNWEREIGLPLSSAQVGKATTQPVSKQPAAATQIAGR